MRATKRQRTAKVEKRAKAAKGAAAGKVITVPPTPAKAFNASRRPSTLLLAQLDHLQWAALPASKRAPGTIPTHHVKTEGEAAERIGALTKAILAAKKYPAPPKPARRTPRTQRKK